MQPSKSFHKVNAPSFLLLDIAGNEEGDYQEIGGFEWGLSQRLTCL